MSEVGSYKAITLEYTSINKRLEGFFFLFRAWRLSSKCCCPAKSSGSPVLESILLANVYYFFQLLLILPAVSTKYYGLKLMAAFHANNHAMNGSRKPLAYSEPSSPFHESLAFRRTANHIQNPYE